MKIFYKQNNKNEKGFTLLFAVLVSTLILAVGASIISIALKQIILSGSARDSQFAFYASNTGIECGLYWDFVGIEDENPVFATSSDSLDNYPSGSIISCADTEVIIDTDSDIDYEDDNWSLEYNTDAATTTFRIILDDDPDGLPYCVDVEIAKWNDSGDIKTSMNSRGYNTCNENDKRRIERGLRITY